MTDTPHTNDANKELSESQKEALKNEKSTDTSATQNTEASQKEIDKEKSPKKTSTDSCDDSAKSTEESGNASPAEKGVESESPSTAENGNTTNAPSSENAAPETAPATPTEKGEKDRTANQSKASSVTDSAPSPAKNEQQEAAPNETKGAQETVKEKESKATNPSEDTDKSSFAEEEDSVVTQEEEDDDEDQENDIPMKPYDEMNLDALSEELQRLLKAHPVKKIRAHVREIKSEFDLQFGEERDKKKEAFLNDGGSIIDFSYSTATERKFNKLYFEYKEKRDSYYKQVRKNLQENLERRLALIEELKAMIGAGNDMNANFNKFKSIQSRWRKAGPVPRADYKDTWNTYHYHVERFYEFLHLDREFREMDYKHNLEQKLKMIARAEELIEEPNVNRAFRELQNLHRMWKEEVGPVAQEYREPVWEKFSAATKKIHAIRKAHYQELDKKREENLTAKQEIIAGIEALTQKTIKSHRQAQKEIKEFKAFRDRFFKAGKVPQKNNKEVWHHFKTASREFNHKKNDFYRERKEEQKENLQKKMELIKIAEENQDREDFEEVTPVMKKIQSDWKKIGFVPRQKSNKIWKRFKKACNHYFDRLHHRQDEKNKEVLENYEKKAAFLKEVEALKLTGRREEDLPVIKEKIEAWKNMGRVPNDKRKIEKDFNKTLDKLFSQLDLNRKEAEMLKYENRLQSLENTGDDYKIEKEASYLRKKIAQVTGDLRQLETNLEFFNNADKSNPLMKEALKNIDRHKQQLKIWKAKLDKLQRL